MMTIAEKIRYFRTAFGMTQETLSELSGINVATIKKYEYGERNPKPDQILKITKALGISIYAFMDFDISTVSDVISLIMKLDEQTGISFDTISKILNTDREPNTVTLGKLAAALGVEPEELMKNED